MNTRKRIVIVGATSAIAKHCARLWLETQPADLTLVGRDAQRLERVAADLKARSPQSQVRVIEAEFLDPAGVQQAVAQVVEAGRVDIALIAHGSLPDQSECQRDLGSCHEAININAMSPVLYAEAFAYEMEKAGQGTIVLIGSVAGDRGRKSNYVYGAAKGLVTRYAQGLQHRFAGTGVRVVLVKPGPTDTPMTAQLKSQGARLAPVEDVARAVVKGVEAGKPVVYAPGKWRVIMLVLIHVPARIFNKLNI